jgi:hypothetical protein
MLEPCPLCQASGQAFYKNDFYICPDCGGIFRPRQHCPSLDAERARYDQHNNNVDDLGHQQFVAPLVKAVVKDFSPQQAGLDFGAGKNSVVAKLLTDQGYTVKQYDPFFQPSSELLAQQYDFIICCEVIEHFQEPLKEFRLLQKLLKPTGCLYCMTKLYAAPVNFGTWYYKNDFTHVFLYQARTLAWLKASLGFKELNINARVIKLQR